MYQTWRVKQQLSLVSYCLYFTSWYLCWTTADIGADIAFPLWTYFIPSGVVSGSSLNNNIVLSLDLRLFEPGKRGKQVIPEYILHLGPLVWFLKTSIQISSVILTLFFLLLLFSFCHVFLRNASSVDIISNCLIFYTFFTSDFIERYELIEVTVVLLVSPSTISSFSYL